MAQPFNIHIPTNPDDFLDLNENILEKHDEDAIDSPLNNVTNLDMVDMQAKFTFAKAQHVEAIAKGVLREQLIEQRNTALGLKDDQGSYTEGTALYLIAALRDDLVGHFRGEERMLGLWGYIVDGISGKKPRIVIPRKPSEIVFLANRIAEKHEEDDVDSLLDDSKVTQLKDLVDTANDLLKEAKKVEKLRKNLVEQRNRAIGRGKKQSSTTKGTLLYYVSSARDVLKGNFRGNEMELGLWGFEVQYSSPTPPTPDPTSANLNGKVLNAITQEFVSGVSVQLTANSGIITVESTLLGDYAAVIPMEVAELITIEVNHPGYQPYSVQQMLTPGDDLEIDINLQPL